MWQCYLLSRQVKFGVTHPEGRALKIVQHCCRVNKLEINSSRSKIYSSQMGGRELKVIYTIFVLNQ